MDLSPENPFADLMSKAVKLKGHQQAQLRTMFDSWPQYFQHSMFMQETVLSVRDKPFPERFSAAESMKVKGNEHFTNGDLEEAVAEYEKALAVFKYCENTDPGWKKKGIEDKDIRVVDFKCDYEKDQQRLNALKISCYLNIAGTIANQRKPLEIILTIYAQLVCKFKLNEFQTCIRACDDTLAIDSNNVKAYYRRAQALITPKSSGAVEFERAIADLQKAYDIDPENRDVRKLLRELKEQRARQKKLDRETFSGMFARGQVYKDDELKKDDEENDDDMDETKHEEKFQKEVEEAETLARMCESKGQAEYAKEIRTRIEQAKMARQRRLKQVDFFHPTQEMIDDAKKNGIDLTDPQVQQMLHELQEQERKKQTGSSTTTDGQAARAADGPNPIESVDSILKSMTNAQITAMLQREGIDYHKITDRDQFMETARHVLLAKLDAETGKKKKSAENKPYYFSIFLMACAWTLLRLYTTGTLSRLWQLATTGNKGATSSSDPSVGVSSEHLDTVDFFDE